MDEKTQRRIDKVYTDIWFLLKGESQMVKEEVMRMLGYFKFPKGGGK